MQIPNVAAHPVTSNKHIEQKVASLKVFSQPLKAGTLYPSLHSHSCDISDSCYGPPGQATIVIFQL